MRQNHPCSLTDLFADSNFNNLQVRAQHLAKLNRVLQTTLEQHQIKQCKIANFRNGTLILETASSVWLNRLNYARLQIIQALRKELPGLVSLEVNINPELAKRKSAPVATQTQVKPNPRKLSQTASDHIMALAETAPDGLKEKLERLAALAGERNTSA